MIQLYVSLEVYPKRRHIFPLLKPFEKGKDFSDTDRIKAYGISEKEITFVNSIEASDYVILPMSWNFYIAKGLVKEVETSIKEAVKANKTVLSFMVGDFGIKVPNHANVIIFRNSGDIRKLPKNHLGLPVFIEDPLLKIFKTVIISERPYQKKPTIGFCGQANPSLINASKEVSKTLLRNVISVLGLSKNPSQQLLSTTYLRASLLKKIKSSSHVSTNFIYRKKYRAGAVEQEIRNLTTFQFYENMRDSDYVLCVRGAGNFSVRFYETLAMGRIPVFVDTNCLLPLSNKIDWKKHVVWVDYKDRNSVAEKVRSFHSSLTAEKFKDLQEQNRTLSREHLTLGGFFKSYFNTVVP